MPTLVDAEATADERGALLLFLEAQRGGLRRTLLGLTDEQAARRPSAGGLSLSGLLKHVTEVERGWVLTAGQRPQENERDASDYEDGFRLVGGETVAGTLDLWDRVARETEEYVRSLPDLEGTFPLPEAPWFPPGAERSQRWMLLHLIEEIARHAGHADILRESLDGKTAYELMAEETGAGSPAGATAGAS